MKKILKVLCCLIFLISGSLVVFACKTDPIVLNQPFTLGFVIGGERSEETGEIISEKYFLACDQNPFAYSYRFFITDSENYENEDNYIQLNDVPTYYIDVTDLIDRQKTYHFFVQYIGSGRYVDSEFSDIKEIEPKKVQIDSPYIQMVGESIFWFTLQNASGYEVYETILDANGQVLTNQTKIASLSSDEQSYNFSNRVLGENAPYQKFVYQVKALGEGNFTNSNLSLFNETAEYVKEISLSAPTNLQVDFSEKTLSFNESKYATKYEIKISRSGYEKTIFSETNNVNLEENDVDVSKLGTYNFVVKAVESDAIKYNQSSSSEVLTQDNTAKFAAPTNITITPAYGMITISWDEVCLQNGDDNYDCQSYTLRFSWNGEDKDVPRQKTALDTVTDGEKTRLSLNVSYSDLFKDATGNKEISVQIKADSFGAYISESDFAGYVNPLDETDTTFIFNYVETQTENENE